LRQPGRQQEERSDEDDDDHHHHADEPDRNARLEHDADGLHRNDRHDGHHRNADGCDWNDRRDRDDRAHDDDHVRLGLGNGLGFWIYLSVVFRLFDPRAD
jgi:hypothetical protein